jgi:hypothetical protein
MCVLVSTHESLYGIKLFNFFRENNKFDHGIMNNISALSKQSDIVLFFSLFFKLVGRIRNVKLITSYKIKLLH